MSIQFKGKLEKVTWNQVRAEVSKINPEFAAIIDEIDPSDQYWVAKVTYPYGSLVMKKALLMLPNKDGDIVPITDPSMDPEIRDGLEYNLKSNPVSFVLKNTFEIFLPLEDSTIPIPVQLSGLIYTGAAFGAWRVLNIDESQHPAFIWDMSAGARSIFMLPKISEEKKHMKLRKVYNINTLTPRNLMDHWEIFRELANHSSIKNPWVAEIIYFSKTWFDHLKDHKWRKFYSHFQNAGWKGSEFWRNVPLYNLIFSLIVKDYEGKLNASIMDTVKYLLYIGMGSVSGHAPALNDQGGPFSQIQRIYQEDYDLKNYPPIIMQPTTFNLYDHNSRSVYYSLQFPNALEFKPNNRVRTSIISDLHEIRALLNRCQQELSCDKFNIKGIPLHDLFHCANYDYFHNGVELHYGMKNSTEISINDETFLKTIDGKTYENFPDASSFVRGCIRVSHKKNNKI